MRSSSSAKRRSSSSGGGSGLSSSRSSQNRIASSRCSGVRAMPRQSQRMESSATAPRKARCVGDAPASRSPSSMTSSTVAASTPPPYAAPPSGLFPNRLILLTSRGTRPMTFGVDATVGVDADPAGAAVADSPVLDEGCGASGGEAGCETDGGEETATTPRTELDGASSMPQAYIAASAASVATDAMMELRLSCRSWRDAADWRHFT